MLLVEVSPGVSEPLPGSAAAGQESRGTDMGSGEQLLGPSGGASKFGISSMALNVPQDPVFRVISQQRGNLAAGQAEEELESSFLGSHVLWGKKEGGDGGHQLWSTGPPSSPRGHQLDVRLVSGCDPSA